VSPKLSRLLFVATLAAGFSAPMFVANAASVRGVDVHDPDKGGFVVPSAQPPNRIEITVGDTVQWTVYEGKHNITPKDQKQWGGPGSGDLTPDSDAYSKQFKSATDYFYYCSIHSGPDDVGKQGVGMWGVIHVIDPTTNTQPPATQPPTTQPSTTQPPTTSTTATTRPGATPPATTATAPPSAGRPAPTAPAPTTTTAKGEKDKKPKDETTTTSSTLPPPIDLPDSAIIPTLPGASTTSSADPGASAQAPTDTPEGEAVAPLKAKKNDGGDALKLLIVSGLGLGALGIGSAGYKYANRSSKYFPA
jgi:plastocyanin